MKGEEEVLFYISKVSGCEVFLTADRWYFNASLLLDEKVESFIKKVETRTFTHLKKTVRMR